MALRISRTVFSALSGMRLLACLIVAPQRGYDEPAILSYAISSFCPTSADGLHDCFGGSQILWVQTLVSLNTPLLPGIYFGMVLGLAIWFWVSRSPLKILTALGEIDQMLKEIAAPGKIFPPIKFVLAVCGVLGGLVGSTILTFGLSLVCKEFGAFENWARIVMPGTALGVLLELLAKDDKLPVHIGSILPLFLAWQVTVAAIIGYCIVPRTGDCKPVPQ